MNPPPPDPSPAGGETVGFSTADAKRVGAAVKYVEQAIRLGVPVGRGPRGGMVYLRKAMTGTAIPAASSQTSPGSGTVTIYEWSGTAWASAGYTVTAYNPDTGNTVAGSKLVTLGWVSGIWEVILEVC